MLVSGRETFFSKSGSLEPPGAGTSLETKANLEVWDRIMGSKKFTQPTKKAQQFSKWNGHESLNPPQKYTVYYIYNIYLEPKWHQMTFVLVGKGLVLGGWPSKIEVIGTLGVCMCIYIQYISTTVLPRTKSCLFSWQAQPSNICATSQKCLEEKTNNEFLLKGQNASLSELVWEYFGDQQNMKVLPLPDVEKKLWLLIQPFLQLWASEKMFDITSPSLTTHNFKIYILPPDNQQEAWKIDMFPYHLPGVHFQFSGMYSYYLRCADRDLGVAPNRSLFWRDSTVDNPSSKSLPSKLAPASYSWWPTANSLGPKKKCVARLPAEKQLLIGTFLLASFIC